MADRYWDSEAQQWRYPEDRIDLARHLFAAFEEHLHEHGASTGGMHENGVADLDGDFDLGAIAEDFLKRVGRLPA